RLRDPLPAADRRAVEAETLVERRLVERTQRQRHVLPASEQVAELEVDELRLRLPGPLDRLPCGGSFLGPVRDVVLRLQLGHAASFLSDQQKRPGTARV